MSVAGGARRAAWIRTSRRARGARRAALAALPGLAACDPVTRTDARLDVTPAAVACVAGDAVRLDATVDGGHAAAVAFGVDGDAAWLVAVARDRGTATVACEAAGRAVVTVEGAGRRVLVPVTVQPPPAGTLRATVAPSALALVAGTTAYLDGRVESSRAGVSTDVRYSTRDTAVAVVDSIFGLVRATGAGTTTLVAAARADRRVTAEATVVVTRSSTLVTAIFPAPPALAIDVGDSARVSATIQLAATAPPGTSRAVAFATSDAAVAVVSPDGVVRGVGPGTTTILLSPVAAPLLRARVAVSVRAPLP